MGKKDNFDYVWDNWIVPIIEQCINGVDKEYFEVVNMKKCDFSLLKRKCGNYAQEVRLQLKKEHYGKHKQDIDLHHLSFCKLASIICDTLITYKVVKFDTNKMLKYKNDKNISEEDTDWLVRNALINYKIAFYSSLSFLYHSMEFKLDNDKTRDLYNQLIEQKGLLLYPESIIDGENKQEPFDNYIIIALAKTDFKKNKFDYFLFSSVLLGIQEYNMKIISTKNK